MKTRHLHETMHATRLHVAVPTTLNTQRNPKFQIDFTILYNTRINTHSHWGPGNLNNLLLFSVGISPIYSDSPIEKWPTGSSAILRLYDTCCVKFEDQ